MDLTRYDKKTNNLIQKMFHQKGSMDEGVLDTLDEILETAETLKDDVLLGFAHYHLADSIYAFEIDYGQFRHHMSRAVFHLINADEGELLTRAYNYLGIDAMNNGTFDVAYYHFMNALNTCEPLNDTYLPSIVNNNVGQLYARMNDYEKALEHVHLGNEQQMMSSKDDVYYYQNIINGLFSEGVLNVFLGNYDRARELDRKIQKIDAESGMSGLTNTVIPVSFLRLQLALIGDDEELIGKYLRESMRMVEVSHRLYDFITDMRDLCAFLTEHEYYEIVRSILDAITPTIMEANVPRMKQHLYAMEIAYHEKMGNHDKLVKVLLEQHHTELDQEEEQNRIRKSSMELIDTMNHLRMQSRILEAQAHTDSLTGIPNRLSMEKDLNDAFDKASADGTNLAIEILDIDSFKDYNDFYGHPAGDMCLKMIAKAISDLADEEGFRFARYGGDEFVLILEDKTNDDVLRITKKLKNDIYDLAIAHEKSISSDRISISQGVCSDVPRGRIKPWDFFSMADDALYTAKSHRYSSGKHSSICLVNLS